MYIYVYIVGVMKMQNIVLRAGIEHTYLTFQVSVLTIKPPDVTTIPKPTCLCNSLLEKSVQSTPHSRVYPLDCKYFNACNYIHTSNHLTQGGFNNHTACSLYRILIMASV